ncbi:MAG: tetratricopeptide repeat protein [Candidatus Cloacimonetes bacterium]|nr:tetratricopeptide repeat protein [Candidatus Cloacimonadota bacterium]
MSEKKVEKPEVIKEIFVLEFEGYGSSAANEKVLTYLVIDRIITGLIKQNVAPSVKIDYFDMWFNLFISGDYVVEFSEDSLEVHGWFTVNSRSEPDKYLRESLEFAGGKVLENSILEDMFKKILKHFKDIRSGDKENTTELFEAIDDLDSTLKILRIAGLYLNEQFEECADLLSGEPIISTSDQISFISLLIYLFLSMIKGDGAKVIEILDEIDSGEWDANEFMDFKSGIYMTIGCYLEESNQGLNKLLHDQEFPNSEKFTLLFSMIMSAHLLKDKKTKKHYLKLAENYTEDSIHQVMILIEAYNNLGFWKDALHLITSLEKEQGEKMVLTFGKARVLMTGGKYQEALELLETILADGNEDNVDMLVVKGDCLVNMQKFEEGIACLQRVLEIEPDNASAMINLGVYYFYETKDYRQSMHYLLAAEKQGPLHPQVYEIISEIYHELGLRKKYEEYENKAQGHHY